MKLNEITKIVACREEMSRGELALVMHTDGSNTSTRLDGVCPVHGTTECLETYLSQRHVAAWSLSRFLQWRRDVRSEKG